MACLAVSLPRDDCVFLELSLDPYAPGITDCRSLGPASATDHGWVDHLHRCGYAGRLQSLPGSHVRRTTGCGTRRRGGINAYSPLWYEFSRFSFCLRSSRCWTDTPWIVSECAPRAIRGGLTGFYQLFIVIGTMISFWINYASLTQGNNGGVYQLPLGLQAIPAVFVKTQRSTESCPASRS